MREGVVTPIERIVAHAATAAGLAGFLACGGGGGYGGGTQPSPVSGSPGPVGATITIGANGAVSPSSVTINVGESVQFVNNHSQRHEMASDPHPAHTDCTQINALGIIEAGQTKNTNGLTTARTCGFHDHLADTNPNLRGTIIIR
jgi:plastocyanin